MYYGIYICSHIGAQRNIDTSRDTVYTRCIVIQRHNAIQCIGCITTPQAAIAACRLQASHFALHTVECAATNWLTMISVASSWIIAKCYDLAQ